MTISAGLLCMALAVYHEARGESDSGQTAIAQVVFNRAKGKKDNICGVTKKPGAFAKVVSDSTQVISDLPAFEKALKISEFVIKRKRVTSLTHFHTKAVHPKWADSEKFEEIKSIGNHIFYARLGNAVEYF